MNGPDFQEGLDTARMLVVKCVKLPIEEQEQVVLDTLLDLIDLPLGWNNLVSGVSSTRKVGITGLAVWRKAQAGMKS